MDSINTYLLFWLLFSIWNCGYSSLLSSMEGKVGLGRYLIALLFGPVFTAYCMLYSSMIRNTRARVIELVKDEESEK